MCRPSPTLLQVRSASSSALHAPELRRHNPVVKIRAMTSIQKAGWKKAKRREASKALLLDSCPIYAFDCSSRKLRAASRRARELATVVKPSDDVPLRFTLRKRKLVVVPSCDEHEMKHLVHLFQKLSMVDFILSGPATLCVQMDSSADDIPTASHFHSSISSPTRLSTPLSSLPLVSSTVPLPRATTKTVPPSTSPHHAPVLQASVDADVEIAMRTSKVEAEHCTSIVPATSDFLARCISSVEASQPSHTLASDPPFLAAQTTPPFGVEQSTSSESPSADAELPADDPTATPFLSLADSEATLVSLDITLKGLKLVEAGDYPSEEGMCTRNMRHSLYKTSHTPYNARGRHANRRRTEKRVKASVSGVLNGLNDGGELPDYEEEVEPKLAALFAPVVAAVTSLTDDADNSDLPADASGSVEGALCPKTPSSSLLAQATNFLDDLASLLHSAPPVSVAA